MRGKGSSFSSPFHVHLSSFSLQKHLNQSFPMSFHSQPLVIKPIKFTRPDHQPCQPIDTSVQREIIRTASKSSQQTTLLPPLVQLPFTKIWVRIHMACFLEHFSPLHSARRYSKCHFLGLLIAFPS